MIEAVMLWNEPNNLSHWDFEIDRDWSAFAGMVRLAHPEILSCDEVPVEVKIRYRHPSLPASLRMLDQVRAQVRFQNRGPAVTPGQACVFYRGDEVLGGGIIEAGLEN